MEPRAYRHWVEDKGLTHFSVTVKETDLYIRASHNLERKAHRLVQKCRARLEEYITRHPAFLTSLEPLPLTEDAPQIVRQMLAAAEAAGVGPMAAVAGAVAEMVGRGLLEFSPEIIVENGGDIFLKSLSKRTIGIYAGESPLSGRLGLEINGRETPLGICTSSGTVGHSLSFGTADAVVAVAPSTALADAAATAIGNLIKDAADIAGGIDFAKSIKELQGVAIIKGEHIGLWGEIKLCHTSADAT